MALLGAAPIIDFNVQTRAKSFNFLLRETLQDKIKAITWIALAFPNVEDSMTCHNHLVPLELDNEWVCEEVGKSFQLWDTMFKAIHEEDPSRKHCTNAQKLINLAMNY